MNIHDMIKTKKWAILLITLIALLAWAGKAWLVPLFFEQSTGASNASPTFESSQSLTDREIKDLADELTLTYRQNRAKAVIPDAGNADVERLQRERVMALKSVHETGPYPHIGYFQRAGIKGYVGSSTCLQCHATLHTATGKGGFSKVNTLEDVVDTVHFRSQQNDRGLSPWTLSVIPVEDVSSRAKEEIDCLICHADVYDIKQRVVITDDQDHRWNQDRSLRSAMTVGVPTVDNCLNCHQTKGYEGTKRAIPFSPTTDIHARVGMTCLDCHLPQGHKIPLGAHRVDLAAHELPEKRVSCEGCHTQTPHVRDVNNRAILNGHVARLACETCHIRELASNNVVLRDWAYPVQDKKGGIHTPVDVFESGKPGQGMIYLWFNGTGTLLANALGDHPSGDGRYNPWMNQLVHLDDPEVLAAIRSTAERLKVIYPDIDVDRYVREAANPLGHFTPEQMKKRQLWIEENIRPLMQQGISRITPFQLFNARMVEDMSHQGLFGAIILPFDIASYHKTGDPIQSVKIALNNPRIRRMVETPLQATMKETFMIHLGIESWSADYPLTPKDDLKNVATHWMRQMATLMVNHGIQRDGRTCRECHAEQGILDFDQLGYTPERTEELRHLPELKNVK
ncbi:MAG: nitrite reductase [Nitrospirae bacterium]|nr:nitrite reductase [Magnetococcales bacterium]